MTEDATKEEPQLCRTSSTGRVEGHEKGHFDEADCSKTLTCVSPVTDVCLLIVNI